MLEYVVLDLTFFSLSYSFLPLTYFNIWIGLLCGGISKMIK